MAARYSAEVLRRCQEPVRAGAWPDDDRDVGTGTAGSLASGSMARLQLKVDGRRLIVEDARFKVFGCSAAIASASLAAECVVGVSLETARGLDAASLAESLSLPDDKRAMAALAADAARAAVEDWIRKAATRDRGPETGELP